MVSANIPLFTQHTSQLHRIIPLPIRLNGGKVVAQPSGHYLIYNFNRDAYHIMTQAELNMCQLYIDDEYVCEGNWPWVDANDHSCEVYSLKPLNAPRCQFSETKMESLWTKLQANNRWLFKVFQPTTAHVSCSRDSQQIVQLPSQGIITMKPGCTLRVKGATISTPFNLESKKVVEDKSSFVADIDRLSNFSVMPLGPMVVNHSARLAEIESQLKTIDASQLNLKGLNFHHISGHLSLMVMVAACIIALICSIRRCMKPTRVASIHFAPPQNV